MQRVINFLWYVVLVLSVLIISFSLPSQGAVTQATQVLRETSVMVNGTRCTGSGSIVQGKSGKRYVLTNAHVCNCAAENGSFYSTRDDGEVIEAHIVKRSWAYDLCAGSIDEVRPTLKLAPQLMPLSEVQSRGYPGGRMVETHGRVAGYAEWSFYMSIADVGACPQGSRSVLGLNGNVEACGLRFTSVMTSLYGRPGSSGSPVVNDNGQLVGVISSWMPGEEYAAGMVPFSQVERFLGAL